MTELPTKVVFLDIDGPMIPATQLLVDGHSSIYRIFPTSTIACMNALCERSQAKIVFNTTHNQCWNHVDDIEVAIVKHGLLASHIHPTDIKTRYPSLRRPEAIQDWLLRHSEVESWVAVDDVLCADEEHMVLIDPSPGIHIDDINLALSKLGGEHLVFLM